MTPKPPLEGDLPSPALHFDALARRMPSRICVVVNDVRYSRGQILDAADALAAGLWEYGVREGDRIAIIRRNAVLHLVAFLAASRLGAILVPLNFRLSHAEFEAILADCGASVLICSPRFCRDFDDVGTLDPEILCIVDDIDPSIDASENESFSLRWHHLSELYHAGEGRVPDAVPIFNDTPATIIYTSGSTGSPKGVPLSYGNLYASWNAFSRVLDTSSREVALASAPFGHVGGLNVFTLATLLNGGTVVVLRRWDVGDALELIEKHRVTRTFAVPTMYDAMARHPDFPHRDLSSLKTAIVGGAPVPHELLDIFRKRGVPMGNSWGMTEMGGGGTLTPPDYMDTHYASIGRPIPGVRMRIIGTDGEQVPLGEVGELWVNGPSLTDHYWGMEPSPDQGFRPGGWFATGDLVRMDNEGFYWMEGRVKDLIISGGENIYPAEIEKVLLMHPTVEQAVVVGAPDKRWGEIPVAFVVGPEVATETVRLFVGEHLARYKMPREMWIVDEIPHGPTGKPDRAELTRRARERHDPGPEWYAGI